ncbi:MAG TPA: hypothetical protein DIW31_05930 [Bacteroidales bacterium]|nr:hypothetical protein [Bacteroidales bacterium]
MKKYILFLAILLVILGHIRAQEKRIIDSLVFTKMYSERLEEERKIVVHLPLNYAKEPNKRYPVMFVLDAGKLDFDISDRLFTLSSSDITPESIVVGILNNKGKRETDLTPPFMQTETGDTTSPFGKADNFLKFIKDELIPFVDNNYRTTNYRTISGHSRAGLFVLYTLIEQPSLFNARFCYSTPAWRFDNIIIRQLESSVQKQKYLEESYLFFSAGVNENPNIIASFHELNEMLKKIDPKHLEYNSYLTPLADHQSNPVFSTSKALVYWSEYLKKQKIHF